MNLDRGTGIRGGIAGRLAIGAELVGFGVLAWQPPAAHAANPAPAPRPPVPEKSPGDDDDKDGDGYDDEDIARELTKLPPRLQPLVRELRAAAVENLKRPPDRNGGESWIAFNRRQIEALAHADVAALAAGVDENLAVHFLLGRHYREPLFQRWAARDHAAARAHVMKVAVDCGYRHDEKDTWRLAGEWGNDENHIFVTRGHASSDPAAAWKVFLAELEDPAMAFFGDARTSTQDILQAYASKDPAEAWKVVLSAEDAADLGLTMRGFMAGAPSGRDWRSLITDWEKACRAMGEEPGSDSRRLIAARWVMDDPGAGFEWFCQRVTVAEMEGERPIDIAFPPPPLPAPLPGLEASGDATELKLAVLKELYRSYELRGHRPAAIEALRRLAAAGKEQAEWVARFIDREIGQSDLPSSLDLLQVVPAIEAPGLRAALFLRVARAVPARGDGIWSERSFEHPNGCLDAVRELSRQLELPDEVKQQAEANFKEVEALEAELRAEQAPGAAKKWRGEFVLPEEE